MQINLRQEKSFRGGFKFRQLEGEPEPRIEEVKPEGRLRLLLRQGHSGACLPAVQQGQRVVRGQVIARGDTASYPVHAPVSGVVVEVAQEGGEGAPALIIEPDGRSGQALLPGATTAIETLGAEQVQRLLHEAGVGALFYEGFPSPQGGCGLAASEVKAVLVSAISTEPFLPRPAVLLADRVEEFATGLRVLHQALPQAMVLVGHNTLDRKLFQRVEQLLDAPSWLRFVPLLPKYPQEDPVVLSSTVLAVREVPLSPARLGVVVGDAQAVLHAKEAVVDGQAVTERVVALGGQAFRPTGYVRARIGTPLRAILDGRLQEPERACVVVGGVLRGRRIVDLDEPVTRSTSAVAALPLPEQPELLGSFLPGTRAASVSGAFASALLPFARRRLVPSLQGERRPCVQCNYCEEVCPVGIIPHLLSKQVTHNLLEESERFGILTCIECGLCSYVCPSKIDLLADIQCGKRTLIKERESYGQPA